MEVDIRLHTLSPLWQFDRICEFRSRTIIGVRRFYHRNALQRICFRKVRHRCRHKSLTFRHLRNFNNGIGKIRKMCGIRCYGMRNCIYKNSFQFSPFGYLFIVVKGENIRRMISGWNQGRIVTKRY